MFHALLFYFKGNFVQPFYKGEQSLDNDYFDNLVNDFQINSKKIEKRVKL
jgi:hypothetical protein